MINKSSENIDNILKEYFEILQSTIKNIPDNKSEISRLEKQIDTLKQKREKYWNTIWMAKYLMMNLFQEIKNI